MTVVSRTPVQLDVGVPKQLVKILQAAKTHDQPLRQWKFIVPQMVADGFLCAIARRQGSLGPKYIEGAWDSYPTVGSVPVVPDQNATEIVLHDHRSEP